MNVLWKMGIVEGSIKNVEINDRNKKLSITARYEDIGMMRALKLDRMWLSGYK